MTHLIVGLGNPGKEYKNTRHNIGFRAVDLLSDGEARWKHEASFEAETIKIALHGHEAILAKPQTYMNLAGQAVQKICRYFKIAPTDAIVLQDDIDLPLGTIRIRGNGSSGGHNGIASIIEAIGPDFVRVKLGIGRSDQRDTKDFVLAKFAKDEIEVVKRMLGKIPSIVSIILDEGVEEAQNRFHSPL